MPNVASVLKEEIRRLARKETKILTAPLKKALASERKTVNALRKQVAALAKAGSRAGRVAASAAAAAPVVSRPTATAKGWRKDTVRSTRNKLGLTQAQMAKLLGVSQISVSFWETGRSTPRAKAQAKVLEARKLSKAQVAERLGGVVGRRKPGPKPGKKASKKTAKKVARKAGKKAGKKAASRKTGRRKTAVRKSGTRKSGRKTRAKKA